MPLGAQKYVGGSAFQRTSGNSKRQLWLKSDVVPLSRVSTPKRARLPKDRAHATQNRHHQRPPCQQQGRTAQREKHPTLHACLHTFFPLSLPLPPPLPCLVPRLPSAACRTALHGVCMTASSRTGGENSRSGNPLACSHSNSCPRPVTVLDRPPTRWLFPFCLRLAAGWSRQRRPCCELCTAAVKMARSTPLLVVIATIALLVSRSGTCHPFAFPSLSLSLSLSPVLPARTATP